MARWTFLLAVPLTLMPLLERQSLAQSPPPEQAASVEKLSAAQLEQMLAPIALYPDELLTQVLVAATYPLEIVLASRWVEQPANKALRGDALVKALESQDWDPSVKSLVPFPSVLKTMSEQLDWTQRLGDAFLAQPSDVFASVQVLRARARDAGTLQSNAQQVVTVQGPAIIIEPAQPETVFVPVYNPSVVFGAWPNPAYPPVYYPPPPGYAVGSALATGIPFGAGIAITGALWGWGRPNWGGGNVNMNVNRFNTINVNRAQVNANTWQHDPGHRRGAAYSNPQLNQQFRLRQGASAASRDAYRGRDTVPARTPGDRPGGGAGNVQRPGQGGQGAGRPQAAQRPAQRPAQQPAQRAAQRPAQRPANAGGALQGAGNGGAARAQSAQGHASRAQAAQRPTPNAGPRGGGGGAARGGGGGRNAGRGGR